MSQVISLYHLLIINIQRAVDHLWRMATGLPQAKRSLITPNLYVGGQYAPHAVDELERLGVTGIVNMRTHSIHQDIKGLKMNICNLPTPDYHAPSQEDLLKGIKFIQKQIKSKGKVYIHCRQGEGRGPTMAIAYLISTGLTYQDAYNFVQKVRTFINLTTEQKRALNIFEKKIK